MERNWLVAFSNGITILVRTTEERMETLTKAYKEKDVKNPHLRIVHTIPLAEPLTEKEFEERFLK